ncbi:MAG: LLM class flavin-dependent oxidoreductase [Actinobacteria bacterium]|nr:LLM class flavin-dependent oxidoreductase [Actinomycetota bacterium]
MERSKVEFGIYVPQIGFTYDEIRARAQLCEELGFHSIWFFDHLYGPELPQQPSFEAWTLTTSVLAHTSRLRAGQLVLSNTFRHPVLLAKMASSLDVISGGRLELGIGSGSYPAEHERAGIPWASLRERSAQLEEALAVVSGMFDNDSTTFDGAHYRVRDMPNLPKPVQRPRPPIHVGGAGERLTLPIVARYADVWNCPTYALGDFDAKLAALGRHCAAIGRDPASIRISHEAVLVLAESASELEDAMRLANRRFGGPGWGLTEGGYTGTPDVVVERIRAQVERGITFFVFFTHDRADPATLRRFAEHVMPAFG